MGKKKVNKFGRRLIFTVGPEHLSNGLCYSTTNGPVALALKDMFPDCYVEVGNQIHIDTNPIEIELSSEGINPYAASAHFYTINTVLENYIYKYDKGNKVKPCMFILFKAKFKPGRL